MSNSSSGGMEQLIQELRSLADEAAEDAKRRKDEVDFSEVEPSHMALAEKQGMKQAFEQAWRLAISKRDVQPDTEQSHEANRDAVPENSKGRMPDEMYEATFDPMFDVADRWGIPMEDAEAFLESVGYFEHAATYDPVDEEHNV
jgi:hypothetical protein